MEVTKDILIQYCELREEIKDLRERIDRDELRLQKIEEEGVVSDTVTGTRADGTIGSKMCIRDRVKIQTMLEMEYKAGETLEER